MGQSSFFQPASDATMSANLAIALRHFSQQLRVAMPARVDALGPAGTVTVQPGFQTVSAAHLTPDGKLAPITPKPLGNVPVMQPQGSSYSVQLPVAVGDTGLLLFADRSLASWMAGDGDAQDPGDPRLHDLSDAIFVPGLVPTATAAAQSSHGTDLVLQNGLATLQVQAAGTYKIGNAAAELVKLTQQLAASINALTAAANAIVCDPLTGKISEPSVKLIMAATSEVPNIAAKLATLVGR